MRVLMATNGSLQSQVALQVGAQIAQRAGEVLTILTVVKRKEDCTQANEVLTHARELLAPKILDIRGVIRVGHPAEEIIHEAEVGRYTLIVVGEEHAPDLMTRFLGSVVKRVIERAPCPVIHAKGKIGPIRRILLCDSNLESPSLLSRFITRLAGLIKEDVELTILHVMSQMTAGPGVRGKQLRATTEELIQEHTPEGELLERDVQILKRLNIRACPKVRHGLVVDEIQAEAQEGDYDLVVIGAHREAGWQRLLLDDLAHQIIVQIDRPVLVVR